MAAESWIRADVASSDEARAVLAHEAVHRAQAAKAGGCAAFFASIATPERYVDVEAEAYCAQLRVLEAAGKDGAALRDTYERQIAHDAGVPPVTRDPFAQRAFPGDDYDLSPASLADVDPALTDLGIAWGAAKAFEHKRRHRSPTV